MQGRITVSIAEDVRAAIDDAASQEGLSQDELINKAIKDYLFFRRFRLLRERMTAKAQAQGIYTDDDVFDRVS